MQPKLRQQIIKHVKVILPITGTTGVLRDMQSRLVELRFLVVKPRNPRFRLLFPNYIDWDYWSPGCLDIEKTSRQMLRVEVEFKCGLTKVSFRLESRKTTPTPSAEKQSTYHTLGLTLAHTESLAFNRRFYRRRNSHQQ